MARLLAGLLVLAALGGAAAVRLEPLSDGASADDDGFGSAVAICDLDGDGLGDMAVGAPRNDSAGPDAGAVYIFSGRAALQPGRLAPANASIVLLGPENGSLFGASLASAGDFNGDGKADLLAGAPGYGQGRGAAFLFLGGRLSNSTALSSNLSLLGSSAGGRLGESVAGAGDLDGDGLDDIAAGEPGGPFGGDVRLALGRRPAGPMRLWDAPADLVLHGPRPVRFGSEVAGAGDLNGDGNADLAVAGQDDRVFVYFGGRGFTDDFRLRTANLSALSQNQSDDTLQNLNTLRAGDDFYYVVGQGRTMAVEDFHDDALDGTVHSAVLNCVYRTRATWAWWNDFTATNAVRFAVAPGGLNDTSIRPQFNPWKVQPPGSELSGPLLGNTSDLRRLAVQYRNNDAGAQADNVDIDHLWVSVAWSRVPNVTVSGAPGSDLGAALSAGGDVDGDGIGDLLAGAPARRNGRGAVFAVAGGPSLRSRMNDTDSRWRLDGGSPGDRLGASVASGRVSLDGLSDIVAGAPGAGKVYVFNGTSNPKNLTAALADAVAEGAPAGLFGAAVAAGDVNGLGRDEVLAGAPGANSAGRAAVYGNADERIVGRPLDVAWLPSFDPYINETGAQEFSYTVQNIAGELPVFGRWYLDGLALPGEQGGAYTYRSGYDSAGDHNVTAVVSDGLRTASHRWTLHVTDVNAPPSVAWEPRGPVSVDEGAELVLRADAVDADGDPLSFTWTCDGRPDGTGEPFLVYAPDFSSAGTRLFACTVDDGQGHAVSNDWTVTVRNVNRPPVIDYSSPAQPDLGLGEGSSAAFAVAAHDPDGGPVAFLWYLDDALAAADTDSFAFRPDFGSAGAHIVRARVSDGELSAWRAWNVTVGPVNAPPAIDGWGPEGLLRIDAGAIALFWVRAHDPNGGALNISWLVEGAPAAPAEWTLRLATSEDSSGSMLVQALVGDGANTVVVNWTLLVNHAPRITHWNPVDEPAYMEPGREAFFFVTPVDPDNDPLTLAWYLDGRLEAGVQGNSARFSLGGRAAGTHRMSVVVSDGRLEASRSWTVVVNGTPAAPPSARIEARPQSPLPGEEMVLSGRRSFGAVGLVNFTWDLGDGTLAYGAEVVHGYAEAGVYTVRLTVTDARGARASASTEVAVAPRSAASEKAEDPYLPLFLAAAALSACLAAAAARQRRALKKLR
jgi:hypothetical protein